MAAATPPYAGAPDQAAHSAPRADPQLAPRADPQLAPTPPWEVPDRPRGLDSYFPAGGEDGATEERRRDDQRMVRYLVIFVALLIGIPALLTILGFVSQFMAGPATG